MRSHISTCSHPHDTISSVMLTFGVTDYAGSHLLQAIAVLQSFAGQHYISYIACLIGGACCWAVLGACKQRQLLL
jgi:poly(3-hydroxyalkanoate) synthetase